MSELWSAITLEVTFHLVDDPPFWADMAAEAAVIDAQTGPEAPTSYSQSQALTVVFHADGLETIQRLLAKHGAHGGWSVDNGWGNLRGIGAVLPSNATEVD